MQLRTKHIGALVGFAFGWLIIQYGIVNAVFMLALAAAGWFVGRILDGEAQLSDYIRQRDDRDLE
jgi:hypothetical protein